MLYILPYSQFRGVRKFVAYVALISIVASGLYFYTSKADAASLITPDTVFKPGSETNRTSTPDCKTVRTVNVSNATGLSGAISAAQPGDTIVLANGSYGGVTMNLSQSGTADRPICIKAANRHQAVLSGLTVNYSGNHITVMHLKVNGGILDFNMNAGTNFRLHDNYFNGSAGAETYMIDVKFSGINNVNFRFDSNVFMDFSGRIMKTIAGDAYRNVTNGLGREPHPEMTPRYIFFTHNYMKWKSGLPEIPGGNNDSHAFKLGADVGNDTNQNLHVMYNTFKDYPGSSNMFLHYKSSKNYFAYNKIVNAKGKAVIGARSGGENSTVGNVIQGEEVWFQLDDKDNLVEGNYTIGYGGSNYTVTAFMLHGNNGGRDNFGIARDGSDRYTHSYYQQRVVNSKIINNTFISSAGQIAVQVHATNGSDNMLPAGNTISGNKFHSTKSASAMSGQINSSNSVSGNQWSNYSGFRSGDSAFSGSSLSTDPESIQVKYSQDYNSVVPNYIGTGTVPSGNPSVPTPTQPPVTQPPVTRPPATQPPVTQPPVTQPPVMQPPVTQPPATPVPPVPVPSKTTIEIVGLANNQLLQDKKTTFEAVVVGQKPEKVLFYIDGVLRKTERKAAYCFAGNNSDDRCDKVKNIVDSKGLHVARVVALDSNSRVIASKSVIFHYLGDSRLPGTIKLDGIKDGDRLSSSRVTFESHIYDVKPASVEYIVDGKPIWIEKYFPYCFGGNNSDKCDKSLIIAKNKGTHKLEVKAYDRNRKLLAQTEISFSL